MLNNSPWLWNARQTMAGSTARTSNGVRILQGKRAKGQSNPSPQYLLSQQRAAVIWGYWHPVAEAIRRGFTNIPIGQYQSNQFFRYFYENAFTVDTATVVPDLIKFSRGVMTATDSLTAVADVSSSTIVVTYPAAPVDDSQLDTDYPILVAMNETTGELISVIGLNGLIDRSAGIIELDVPAGFMTAGQMIDLWLGFRGAPGYINSGTSSDSRTRVTAAVA